MKTKHIFQARSTGSALMLVMCMCAISLIIMAGIMYRTSTVSKLNDRNNKYNQCCIAAGAATEKAFAQLAYYFQLYGLGMASNNLSIYRTNVPNLTDNAYWGQFAFSDGQGNVGQIYCNYLSNYAGAMPSQYTNLSTVTAPIYRIVANAWMTNYPDIIGTAQEDVLLSLLPITTFAIFYNGPLEFTQCATMSVRGRTHANDIICVGTSSSLDFWGLVTTALTYQGPTRDGVTPSPWNQGTTNHAGLSTNVPTITVAMTMTNSHSIIEWTTNGEDKASAQWKVRACNQAQVLLLATNLAASSILSTNYPPYYTKYLTNYPASVTNNPWLQVTFVLQMAPDTTKLPGDDLSPYNYTTMIPNSYFTNAPWFLTNCDFFTNGYYGISTFASLTNTFTDKREYQTNMFVTQINVGKYASWLSTNAAISNKFTANGAYAPILYVADRRGRGTYNTNKLAVVRLVNGAQLPSNNKLGFSVATPNPLYVLDDYNVTADGIHYAWWPDSTTNANTTVPAALLCDAITILSGAFNDSTSSNTIGNASVSNVVNAAIITGNVPSTGTDATTFSGGVHNLMRLQEDWSANNSVLVLNTSIVVLWASTMATNQFRNPVLWSGVVNPYYKPPTRQWGFDPNFYDPAKQPQGVPTALVPIRFNWTTPAPYTH